MFNPTVCNQIAAETEAALQAVAAKHGLAVKRKRGTFSANNFSLSVEYSVLAGTEAMTAEATEYQRTAALINLDPDALFKEFTSNGRRYKLLGKTTRRSHMPMVAMDVETGKQYKFTVEAVRRAQGR